MDDQAGNVQARRQMGRVQVDEAEVGVLADFDGADAVRKAECPRAVDRRHLDHVPRRKRGRVVRDALVDERGEVHLLEHVEIVVRSAAVRSKRDIDAELHRPRDAREAAAELHVARRTVDERDRLLGHDPEVVVGAPHAVSGIAAEVEETRVGEIGDRRLAVPGEAFAVLLLRLGDMEVDWSPEGAVRLRQRAAERLVRQVLGVDAEVGGHRVLLLRAHPLDVAARIGDAVVEATGDEREPDAADVSAHAGFQKRDGHLVGKLVHVGDARRAACEHLDDAPARAGADVLGRHLRFDGKDRLLEPALKGQSATAPAQQGHGGMGVAVDEPGQDERLRAVAHVHPLSARCGDGPRADGGDPAVRADDDVALRDRPPRQQHPAVLEPDRHSPTASALARRPELVGHL